jgi:putative ABC transport system permease protein
MLSDLKYRLRALLRRGAMDRELDDELRFHIEQAVQQHVRAGVPRREAERLARVAFGGIEQIREETRAARGIAVVDALYQDLRYAWRGMVARPGFALAIILTLGLALGANTTMFGVVDRLLLRAPAYLEDADRVHRVYYRYEWETRQQTERNFAYLRYLHVRDHATSFDVTAAFSSHELPVGTGAATRELPVMAASAELFDLFSARPVLGRFFTRADDRMPAGRDVAVLAHAYWHSAYGGRDDVLGETIRVGRSTYEIIGVAPPGFTGPAERNAPSLFIPITSMAYAQAQDYADHFGWSWLEIVVRTRAEVSRVAAEADLSRAFVLSWDAEREAAPMMAPAAQARPHGVLAPIQFARGPDADDDARVAAWVMGVALIVLLIACANVMNLLLLRALSRRREIGMRLALGVSRARLIQQLLTETLLLAVLGGVLALAFAHWGGATLRGLLLPAGTGTPVATDGRTLLFTMVLTLAVALLTGLAPALQAVRADVAQAIREGLRATGYRPSALRTGLLLAQGVLCAVLLIGAGLFAKSLLHVRDFRLGYDTEPVLVAGASLRGTQLTREETYALADRLTAAVLKVPGVTSATLAASVPFYRFRGHGAPRVPGRDSLNLLGRFTTQVGMASYFETTGTRILRGRGIEEADGAAGQPVVVVSESMAQAIWPNEDPIGRQMRIGADSLPLLTVVGVAEDVTATELAGAQPFWYYLPLEQYRRYYANTANTLLVRVAGDARDYAAVVRERLQREMPGEAYALTMPLRDVITPEQRPWQLGATMFLLFAGLALVLATVGLYSVIAYTVAQRRRELGVRIALGASVARVVWMIVAQGVWFAAAAIAVGGLTAAWAARWVEPLLFSVSALDPGIYAGVAAVLVFVAVLATSVPAWRASRVDPTITLRAE